MRSLVQNGKTCCGKQFGKKARASREDATISRCLGLSSRSPCAAAGRDLKNFDGLNKELSAHLCQTYTVGVGSHSRRSCRTSSIGWRWRQSYCEDATILMSDGDGLRMAYCWKGASSIKCCNVLKKNTDLAGRTHGYCEITCDDPEAFQCTLDLVAEAHARLQAGGMTQAMYGRIGIMSEVLQ